MAKTPQRHFIPLFAASYVSLLPAVISIALMELMMMRAFSRVGVSTFALWWFGNFVGTIATGAIADRFCRRKVLMTLHLLGLGILTLSSFVGWNLLIVFLVALFFMPSPVARAALIDGLPNSSRTKVLAIAFVCKFFPWCFYGAWAACSEEVALAILIGLVLFDLLLLYGIYKDQRRIRPRISFVFRGENGQRFVGVLLALLFAEMAFYVADLLTQTGESLSKFTTAVACGLLLGASVHLLVRPNGSALRILRSCYTLGFLVSVVMCLCIFYAPPGVSEIRVLALLLAALGGHYLPVAYNLIVGWGNPYRKGFMCGIVEATQCLAALLVLGMICLINLKPVAILSVVSLLLFGATLVQYSTEVWMLSRLFVGAIGRACAEVLSNEKRGKRQPSVRPGSQVLGHRN